MISLIIDAVPLAVTRDKIEQLFNDLYDATVSVRFGQTQINTHGTQYKTAKIHVFAETRELAHFIDQIKKRGSSTITAENIEYVIHLDSSVLPTTKFKMCMI